MLSARGKEIWWSGFWTGGAVLGLAGILASCVLPFGFFGSRASYAEKSAAQHEATVYKDQLDPLKAENEASHAAKVKLEGQLQAAVLDVATQKAALKEKEAEFTKKEAAWSAAVVEFERERDRLLERNRQLEPKEE